ncbi:MAG: DUF1972 domain-containing protein [Halobacteriota archaeon]
MKARIALLGSRGIPAKYGGFETFVERIGPALVDDGYEVHVSCEGTTLPRPSEYKGVRLFYFPLKPFRRVFYETIYDVYSLVKACVTCDFILMLGYGAGFFFFIPKLFRRKMGVNVDGREWTREKYNLLEKTALYVNEAFALHYSDVTIADSHAIMTYLQASRSTDATFVPYGVDDPGSVSWDPSVISAQAGVDALLSIAPSEYYLIVARLERENNILAMVEAFLTSNTAKTLVVVGNFLDSPYWREVNALIARHGGKERVVFTGGIYDRRVLNMLRQHCFAYLHGHSAGGTNPSLLEAMIAQDIILAHDNAFNHEVCDRFALFFKDAPELRATIESVERHPDEYVWLRSGAFNRAREEYSWERVIRGYEALIDSVMNEAK